MTLRLSSLILLAVAASCSSTDGVGEVGDSSGGIATRGERADPIQFRFAPPFHWTDQYVLTFDPVSPDDQDTARSVLTRALQKYPINVQQILDEIQVVQRLFVDGISVGGSYHQRTVFIAVGRGTSIEQTFHHEFASVLRDLFPSHRDEFNWRELNPPEFHYSGSGWSALRQGKASTRGSWRWYSSGFVSEYATSSFGNDFSTLAEALFMGEPALWNPKFPILARKRDLAIAFYSKLNPSLNTFYFHELHEARASQLGLDPFPMSAPESKPPLLEGALSGNMGGSTR